MVEDFSPRELSLCGYAALQKTGFALPCFASSDNSNTWYVATCSVPTDHSGTVTSFQAYHATGVSLLSPDQARRICIGDPWCDVFLWRGDPFVGCPVELWDNLKSQRLALEAEAPLSLLDLSLFCGSDTAQSVVKSAFEYVSNQLDDARARQWRCNLLIRPMIVRSVLRAISDGRLQAPASGARQIDVVEAGEAACRIEMPEALGERIKAANLVDEVLDEVRSIASALSISVYSAIDEFQAEEALSVSQIGSMFGEQKADDVLEINRQRRSGDVLIVLCGNSAERIRRYIRAPDWYPRWDPDDDYLDNVEPHQYDVAYGVAAKRGSLEERSVIQVVGLDELPADTAGYRVAIFVGDDENLSDITWSLAPEGVLSRFSLASECVILLAPLLPLDRPLDGQGLYRSKADAVTRTYDVILDTALVRSPIRHRGRGRSIFSRTAELVVGAALLCSSENELTKTLRSKRRTGSEVLSLGLGNRMKSEAGDRLDLASENTWGVSRHYPRSILFSSPFEVRSHSRKQPLRGYVEIRERRADFEDFAKYVVEAFALPAFSRDRAVQPTAVTNRAVPQGILLELDFQRYASGFALDSSGRRQLVVVTAEVPKLSALAAASAEGWQVVRYTDADRIREILSVHSSTRGAAIPFELKLPRVRRLEENRNLFLRGVREADFSLFDASDGKVAALANAWRTEGPSKYLVPALDGELGLAIVVPKVKEPRFQAEHKLRLNFANFSKVGSAWREPLPGTTRFAFTNGVLPLQLMELSENQVPRSSLYYVDGTEAAIRSLLQSRVFYVWLRATTDYRAGVSFSLHRSLGGFPIVPPFIVEKSRQHRPYLLLDGNDRSMSRLARDLEGLTPATSTSLRRRGVLPYDIRLGPSRRALDATVLAAYGLHESVTDVDILRRLVELNDRLGFNQESPYHGNH
jgi:hypothetical protein